MALTPLTIFDTFTRTHASDWGVTDSGHDWSAANESTDGTSGVLDLGAASNFSNTRNTVDVNGDDYEDGEVLTLLKWESALASPRTMVGPMLTRNGLDFYVAYVDDSTDTLTVSAYYSGAFHTLSQVARSTSKSAWYWLRFRKEGTSLKAKIWHRTVAEPTSWNISTTTDSNMPTSGNAGIFARRNDDVYTVNVDVFYFTSLSDNEDQFPIIDTFERNVDAGFGRSDSGHTWEGNVSVDPAIIVRPREGSVIDDTDGYAQLIVADAAEHYGFLGPSRSGDKEVLTSFSLNSSAGTTHFYIGLCGIMSVIDSDCLGRGYALKITSGATTISIQEKTSSGGAWVNLATSGAITALVANTKYWVRFQQLGTTLQARIWIDGDIEPAPWNVSVVDASFSSGRSWFLLSQTVTTTRTLKIFSFAHQTATTTSTATTTTGTFVTTAIGDTTIACQANFTNDSDTDNSLLVEYKKSSATTWTTFGGTKTRNSTNYVFTLTGLEGGTLYNVRVTFSDPDTVIGTNPRTLNATTTLTGVSPYNLFITSIAPTAIGLQAGYTNDTDADSTATLERRTGFITTTVASTSFSADNNETLDEVVDDYQIIAGSDTVDLFVYSSRLRMVPSAVPAKVAVILGTNVSEANFEVTGNIYVSNLSYNRAGVIARASNSAFTFYAATYSWITKLVELIKYVNGTPTVLQSKSLVYSGPRSIEIKLVVNADYKSVFVDNVEYLRTTDNTITTSHGTGFFFSSDQIHTSSNSMGIYSVVTKQTTTPSGWVSEGSMTADRPNKRFTKTVSGLTSDTTYEFRVTWADADGIVSGFTPQSITAMTTGQAVFLESVVAEPESSSINVVVNYDYDTNDNSSITMQYRSTHESLWTTVPSELIAVNRGAKTFSTLLTSLRPMTSYQVKVVASDPNGFLTGSVTEISELVTTTGAVQDETKKDKHYLWKVYDVNGNYLETWHDAGEPEFAFDENGGVSDLRVILPRKISTVSDPNTSIAFQNRVDIWCLDPSSEGFGPNLLIDEEFELGSWTLGTNANVETGRGPDDSNALAIASVSGTPMVTRSEFIQFFTNNEIQRDEEGVYTSDLAPVPLVVTAIAKASSSKLQMYVESYDIEEIKIDQSDVTAETVGPEWQRLKVEYIPPVEAFSVRVAFENHARGSMYADKVEVRVKEHMIYRGRIESFTPKVDQSGESVEIEVLGLISVLSDDYIDFLQFVVVQPVNDLEDGLPNHGASDPSDIMRKIIDTAKLQNDNFALYYTEDSIRNTGTIVEYTFRDQQIRAALDRTRSLCPSGWHYYVEPDGLLHLRGPEHARTYKLRLGVEIMNFSVQKSIRNLKNYIHVKGRQDSDFSEADGHGSIHYIAFDQESIEKYGKRMLFIRDANITTPDTAEIVGDGRLEEYNREEQRAQCFVPDEKSIQFTSGALRGFNIETFRPGDNVIILDPIAGPINTYWDQMIWDSSSWDSSNVFSALPDSVPIKTIQFHGTHVLLELSERAPSATGDFGRLYRYLQLQGGDN